MAHSRTPEGGAPTGSTLAEKVWNQHVVRRTEGEPDLLYVDLHLVHEATSPQAFDGLRLAGREVRRPDLTIATEDHNVPTTLGPVTDLVSRTQLEAMQYGFRVVVSSRFGDIFRGNAGKSGLLCAQVTQEQVELIWKHLENDPGAEVTVDLRQRTVTAGDITAPLTIDDYTAWRLLNGLDDIALTLRRGRHRGVGGPAPHTSR